MTKYHHMLISFGLRHVILPKPLLKMIPKEYFGESTPGVLRLLLEEEWRNIGITQSPGWHHYEIHGQSNYVHEIVRCSPLIAPEPHVLLFRRAKT